MLLGDREFIGPVWIQYLQKEKIPYCFRIKEEGQFLENSRGRFVWAKNLFRHLKRGREQSLGERHVGKQGKVFGHVSGMRSLKGELLVVIHSGDLQTPCEDYGLRWEIECLFKGMKSNGFNLEDTHLTKTKRIETLLSVLMISFCYAYDWGEMQEPQKIKSHGHPQHSVFRRGLDALRRALLNVELFINELTKYFNELRHRQLFYSKSFVP